ncbi:MAG: methyltransferase [Actinomycetaceae bacterium]|nr:methyltransferase [Actinomycetaceae bacterium]MDY6142787.1 methyltransferase [Arcanobacterium sp.]
MSEHYFTAHPHSSNEVYEFDVQLLESHYHIRTQAGIFSPRGLDKGSAVFLHKVPLVDLNPGSLAVDLGCGWGPLTLALAQSHPESEVIAVDVNERALALSADNAKRNGLNNVTASMPEAAITQLEQTGRTIDLLWSNPPIRIGKTQLHDLLTRWLNLLSPEGVAYLVVQKNLGADSLIKWLNNQAHTASKVGSSQGYRVIEVRLA